MFGNTKGWIIAIVLFLVMGGTVWAITSSVNSVSSPNAWGKEPKRLESLTLSVAPSTIVAIKPGDATGHYRAAMDDVAKNTKKYEKFIESGKLADIKGIAGIKSLLDASGMPKGGILEPHLQENVGYFRENIPPDLATIRIAGNALRRAGLLYYAAKQPAEAKVYYEALFSLGANLYAERLGQTEAFAGLGYMGDGASGLKQLAANEKDEARKTQIEQFDEARLDAAHRIEEMWKVIGAVGGLPPADRAVANNAGNIFYFTRPEMKERMWRIESTLKLGRFKYNVGAKYGRLANQIAAEERLIELEKDADPAVAHAAKKAHELTIAEFRVIN